MALCSCLVVGSEQVTQILGSSFGFPLENRKVDLPEIQGEALEVARKKCQLAAMEACSFPWGRFDSMGGSAASRRPRLPFCSSLMFAVPS